MICSTSSCGQVRGLSVVDRNRLVFGEVETPTVEDNSVLIKVECAGLNRPDLLQWKGYYTSPPGANPRLGLEVSGTVVQTGQGVSPDYLGERVFALTNGGGFSEYVAVSCKHVAQLPESFSFEEGSILPENYCTGLMMLECIDSLARQSSRLLITAANGGLGRALIHLSCVYGMENTVGLVRNTAALRNLSDFENVSFQKFDSPEDIKNFATEFSNSFSMIVDQYGGQFTQVAFQILKQNGVLAQAAFLKGDISEVSLRQLLFKNITWFAKTLRSQTESAKDRYMDQLSEIVLQKKLKQSELPEIKCFPMSKAFEAFRELQDGGLAHRLVLVPD